MTSFEEFVRHSGEGNVIPICETLIADTETPVSVYLKIRNESPYSFLLESVEGGEKVGRYSFIGFNPFMSFSIANGRYSIRVFHDDVTVLPSLVSPDDPPLVALKKIFEHIKTVRNPKMPRFTGGAVGFFGYECVKLLEELPDLPADPVNLPDALMLFYDVVLVFDNVKHQLTLVSNAYLSGTDRSKDLLRSEYEKAAGEIRSLISLLGRHIPTQLGDATLEGPLKYHTSKEQFASAVNRSREYIAGGDIFQVVLSQRLEQKATVDPFDVYRTLRIVNPSPYMYFLHCGDFQVIGASPEMLVRVEGEIVETRPIAGTRRRGMTPEEDARLEKELLSDPKERAEHLMLVDLGRNDIGRISDYGSVVVDQYMSIERFSHVMHIVSAIRGHLRAGLSHIDALFACFPAGTLTGAPKIRAMEIISELEGSRRGIYGGAIAYCDFSGNLDSCIAIRTIVMKDSILRFQAGAGIVYDSTPDREYEETIEKLGANLKSLQMLASSERAADPHMKGQS